jgi:uncharacterized LabA/DUF88 family protein
MKRIGVFVDVGNLYHCLGTKFEGRRLDFRAYLKYVETLGEVQTANAYGCQVENEAKSFIAALKKAGFSPHYKAVKIIRKGTDRERRKGDWDVGIAVAMIQMLDKLDIVVLGTADSDLEPAVRYVRDRGATVIVLACGIAEELHAAANECIEIPESFLLALERRAK